MAINLLPSEQKIKFKKQKSTSVSQSIEMTGPKKVKKHKSSIKSGGVLGFFKQAFRTPKEEEKKVVESTESRYIKAPQKKVIFKEKISYRMSRTIPKVEYEMPSRKPESLQNKDSITIGNRISNIFDKPRIEPKKDEKPKDIGIKIQPKEEFPKYHSVSTEELFSKKKLKPKKVKIIEVVSEHAEEKDNKKTELSIWDKIQKWLENLFGSKKDTEPLPDSDKISKLEGFPKPRDGKLEITYNKNEIKAGSKSLEEKVNRKNVPVMIKPKVVKPSHGVLAYDVPIKKIETPEIIENKKVEKSQMAEINYSVPIPPRHKEKIDIAVKENVVYEKSKKDRKDRNYFGWLSKFWKSIASIFSHSKIEKKTNDVHDQNLMTKIEENTEVTYEKKHSAFDKIDFSKPDDVIETNNETTLQTPLPPAPKDVPLPPLPIKTREGSLLDITDKFIKQKSNDVLISDKVDVPIPTPPKSITGDEKKKEEKNEIIQTGGTSDEIVGLDWEVNLIPKDEQQKKIPISYILYIIMSIVVSCALVLVDGYQRTFITIKLV